MKIQFISVESLKDKSVIQDNVDEKILGISIREYQDLEMRTVLGQTEYDRLQDVLAASIGESPVPLTDDDKELMSYVTPVMIYGSLMFSIAPTQIRFSNKGQQEITDDHAKSITLSEARSNYAFKLEGYKGLLMKYLAKRYKDEPTDLTKPPERVGIDTTFQMTGIYLPDESKNCGDHGIGFNGEVNYGLEGYRP